LVRGRSIPRCSRAQGQPVMACFIALGCLRARSTVGLSRGLYWRHQQDCAPPTIAGRTRHLW
jgi:hypothetical protein